MQIQAVLDRFEGSKAILLIGEDEVQVVWPRYSLPSEVQEGDILQISLYVDHVATATAKAAAASLLQAVIEKNQEG